jgi:hypothetical protein
VELLLAFKPTKGERLKSAKLKFESLKTEDGVLLEVASDSNEILIAEKQKQGKFHL